MLEIRLGKLSLDEDFAAGMADSGFERLMIGFDHAAETKESAGSSSRPLRSNAYRTGAHRTPDLGYTWPTNRTLPGRVALDLKHVQSQAQSEASTLFLVRGRSGLLDRPCRGGAAGGIPRRSGRYSIGRTQEIAERFYVISAERRIKHPAVSVITAAARTDLFV